MIIILDKLFLEWRMIVFIYEQKMKADELKLERGKVMEQRKKLEKEEMTDLCYPMAPMAPLGGE